MRMERDVSADAADVFFETLLFCGERTRLHRVTRGKFAADGDFLLVGEAREMHGQAGEVALRVGGHVQDGVRRHSSGFCTTLAPVEARQGEAEDREENDEDNGALHRYRRIVSWYRVQRNATRVTVDPIVTNGIHGFTPQKSITASFPMQSKSSTIPVRRKLLSLATSASKKTSTP